MPDVVLPCLEKPGLIPTGLVRGSVECSTQALTPPPFISLTGCTALRAALIGRSRGERFFLPEEQQYQEPRASPRGYMGLICGLVVPLGRSPRGPQA